jgi:hypothetical protein
MMHTSLRGGIIEKVNLFKNEHGIISSEYPPTKEIISNNLDDLFPFFKYFDLNDIIEEQLKNIVDRYGKFPSKNKLDVPLWSYDEWIGALFLSNDKKYHKIGNEILSDVAINSDTFLRPVYSLTSRKAFSNFTPRVYGLFEVVFENKDIIDKKIYEQYCEIFEKTLLLIQKNDFLPVIDKKGLPLFSQEFKMNLLNSFYYNNGIKRKVKVFLITILDYRFRKTMKESTNFLFSFLEYLKFNSTQKNLYKKLIKNIMLTDSIPVKTFANEAEYTVCQSTAIIDNICDFSYFIERDIEMINYAVLLADFFIDIFHKKGYLSRNYETDIVMLDEVMDFAIALKRIYSITSNTEYRDMAEKIFDSCKIFLCEDTNLHYTYIDMKTNKRTHIDPKYNFLFLKGVIIFELEKGKDIYSDELYSLSKDR